MLEQTKFFIETLNEENRKCPGSFRYLAFIMTLPIILVGNIIIKIAVIIKRIETYTTKTISTVFK